MRRLYLYWLVGSAVALSLGMLILVGCGGGGGPLQVAVTTPTTSVTAAFLQLLPAVQRSATTVGTQKCGACHNANLTGWMHTMHAQVNVGCESCHGPGSVHAAAPSAANILTFPNAVSPNVCGQCHGPIATDYAGSPHATPVADPVQSGSPTCLRCHSAEFRAQMIDEPLAQGQTPTQINASITALPTSVLQSFETTTHETASCTNCHDPHHVTTNLTSEGEQDQLRRPTSNLDPSDIAPGVPLAVYSTANQVCGTCHNGWGANPTDANLQRSTSRPLFHEGPQYSMLLGVSGYEEQGGPIQRTSTHAEAPDQCAHCHMPNASHTFTVNLDTSCAPCHTPADAAARETTVQSGIQNDLVALRTRMQTWSQQTFGNPDLWDYTSNIQAENETPPNEAQVPLQIKRARHNYYFIINDRSYGVHNNPYTNYLLTVANNELNAIQVPAAPALTSLTRQQVLTLLKGDFQRSQAAAANAR